MSVESFRKIYRSDRDRVVAGVAAGIADYLGVDTALVRIAFVALAFVGGVGFLVYLLCWAIIPVAPPGLLPIEESESSQRWNIEPRYLVIGGAAVIALLMIVRALDVWPGDGFVWPVILASAGLALLWTRADDERRAGFTRSLRELGASGKGTVLRLVLGVALLVAGVSTFLAASDAVVAAGRGLAAAAVVVAGVVLIFLPWWRRLVRELAEERRERIRSQERAELAAHLHDSVLQTLALIQRRSGDSEAVVQLARRQERELRSWLYGQDVPSGERSLAAALRSAAEEVEDLHGLPIEVVCVGDATLEEPLDSLVGAAREAMVNAARHSGDHLIAVYLEVDEDHAVVFVRDRGVGFDAAVVPGDRKGLTESIVGRMTRAGGRAIIAATPGEGTEIELEMPIRHAAASDVTERAT
jgi:signal transduction histidine kinase/phage shock protein PspC (stress-responsive transcriptional regulator)